MAAGVCDGGGVDAILDEFDEYLALERGRSDHTRRHNRQVSVCVAARLT